MVDGRHPALRPRTRQDEKSLTQPVGWIGQDMGRKMDPVRTFETPIVLSLIHISEPTRPY